mgnify:CR=1 FL=1
MKYSTNFIKEVEQLAYHVNDSSKNIKPGNWKSIKDYSIGKTGFKAEAFVNEQGQKVLVIAGTNWRSVKDDWNDFQILKLKQIPIQAESAYQAYMKLKKRYDNEDIIVVGYSLGGALSQIVCNETGAKGINFAPLGVSDIVKPKYTKQIINYGNENDPFYKGTFEQLLGDRYVIPDDNTPLAKGESVWKHHMPQKIGDVSKAVKYENKYQQARDNSYVLDRYINRNYYDDIIFSPSNRVLYNSNNLKVSDMTREDVEQFWDQYYENGEKFPSKEDMERRVRFGELIYVENYTRSDGTKVSGYYRRYPE